MIEKTKTRELVVVLQRFLAFCDKCHSSAFKHHDADFTLFQRHKHILNMLIKVNTMKIKGIIEETEVVKFDCLFIDRRLLSLQLLYQLQQNLGWRSSKCSRITS